MLKDLKVSVIVPTHNSEVYIEECVRSAMNQTYKKLEIICVDSSSDNTVSILKELQGEDNRITIIKDENSSYGHKLNVGIQHATGEYIAILESDDYILPNMHEVMLDSLPEKVDYIKVAANNFIDVNGKRYFYPDNISISEEEFDKVIELEKNRVLGFVYLEKIWCSLYRKQFLKENEIYANETPGASYQDVSFTYAVGLLAKNCIYKKGAFYCYRNDNQNSSVKSKAKVFCVCDEYKYLEKILKKQDAYTEEARQIILRRKLITYSWNIKRLDAESANAFRVAIMEEMKEYTEELCSELSDYEKLLFNQIIEERTLEEYHNECKRSVECWKHIAQILHKEKCIVIGAGIIGRTILQLQEWLNVESICGIGDNNFEKITNKIKGYDVMSIEEVVCRYPNAYYLVANKNHYFALSEQLIKLGVSSEQLECVDRNMNPLTLYLDCVKQNT